ncbi:MAG: inositol monophosphatase [Acidimicrobiia bacterium]|nr:inositol monophosphatase [Acidimicrobiia bacterium]MDH5292494.1 inositol monophosphatase [Acidimicrobiia bacterium]
MSTDLDVAIEAARAGAAVVKAGFGRPHEPDFKSSAVDPVTETDRASEAAILDVIGRRCPRDATLSEESGGAGWDGARVWIADPLDGTVNFLHGFPHVAVSVALWDDGAPVAAAVIDPIRGEEFTAAAGAGAFLNGVPISVSTRSELGGSLIVTGFPYDRADRAQQYTDVVARVLRRCQGVRRTGSAALDMCYVAAGRFDAYWEYGIAAWDAAAALLLVTEAGGRYGAFGGGPYRLGTGGVVVSNGSLQDELTSVVGTLP